MSITSDELLQNFFKTGSTVSLPRIDSESQVPCLCASWAYAPGVEGGGMDLGGGGKV